MANHRLQKPVALVLGGGRVLGASQVGMLRALHDAAIHPDLVLGTSVGAINGAALAANHGKPDAAGELSRLWEEMADSEIFAGSLLSRTVRVVRTGTPMCRREHRASTRVPVDRAMQLGARTVFVLHVGRLDGPLRPPRRPWEVAVVAFEIARRHRYETTMANLPEDVCVHVLPTGTQALRFNDRSQLRYRDFSTVPERIRAARESTARCLQRLDTRS
jgi:Patatin-like phospholipase